MRAWIPTLTEAVCLLLGCLIGSWIIGSELSLDMLSFVIALAALHGVTRLKIKEN
jgi:hypothetical protein